MPSLNLHPSTITTCLNKPLLTTIPRHHLSTTTRHNRDSTYQRTDFQTQGAGFSSSYDPDQPTRGPLSQASKHGAPRLTPTLLKEHLDKFVVGQDKAKKVVSVAVFNHYQRIREIKRQNAEELARREKQARWEMKERERRAHPLESMSYNPHIAYSCTPYATSPSRSSTPHHMYSSFILTTTTSHDLTAHALL